MQRESAWHVVGSQQINGRGYGDPWQPGGRLIALAAPGTAWRGLRR